MFDNIKQWLVILLIVVLCIWSIVYTVLYYKSKSFHEHNVLDCNKEYIKVTSLNILTAGKDSSINDASKWTSRNASIKQFLTKETVSDIVMLQEVSLNLPTASTQQNWVQQSLGASYYIENTGRGGTDNESNPVLLSKNAFESPLKQGTVAYTTGSSVSDYPRIFSYMIARSMGTKRMCIAISTQFHRKDHLNSGTRIPDQKKDAKQLADFVNRYKVKFPGIMVFAAGDWNPNVNPSPVTGERYVGYDDVAIQAGLSYTTNESSGSSGTRPTVNDAEPTQYSKGSNGLSLGETFDVILHDKQTTQLICNPIRYLRTYASNENMYSLSDHDAVFGVYEV
jgi:hypothetical protein